METNNSQPSELFGKILQGMTAATKKLVEESAVAGRSLVISVDGEVKNVPASKLIAQFSSKRK